MALEQYANQAEDLRDMSVWLQELHDKYARADIECNRVIADVISANGKVEQLVNERANLRAEKRIWEMCVAPFTIYSSVFFLIGWTSINRLSGCVYADCIYVNRACRTAYWKRTKRFRLSGRICRIGWATCRRCIRISSARARMIEGGWRVKSRCWRIRRERQVLLDRADYHLSLLLQPGS